MLRKAKKKLKSQNAKPLIEIERKSKISKEIKLGFLGPKGTFCWAGAKNISPADFSLIPFFSIKEIFEGVNDLEVDFGIVPIQSAIAGLVSETMYGFIDYPLYALGSFKIPVHHCFLSRAKALKEIKIVKSHPQALSQCHIWLERNLPKALKVPTASTISPILEKSFSKNEGFIAPIEAARIFKLNVLEKNIEDLKENFTRFFLISREVNRNILKKTKLEAKNTLLLLSVYDRVGILRDILNIFAKKNINLSALHSIPSHFRPWEYLFFLEIEKSYFSPEFKNVLKEVKKYCPFIRILGIA